MQTHDPRNTQHFGFLLLPRFALMSYAAATEPLRAANLLAGTPLYRVTTFSIDGAPVCASNGLWVPCAGTAGAGSPHAVRLCRWRSAGLAPAGTHAAAPPAGTAGRPAGRHLRRRVPAGGGGPPRRSRLHHPLGACPGSGRGLLGCHSPPGPLILDGDRITCGGGVAPLDMMHALIAERMGSGFARRVSDWYLHTTISEPGDPQRASAAERYGTHHPALLAALETMEATIETPLSRAAVAQSGRSQRPAAGPAVRVKVRDDLACGLSEAAPGTGRAPAAAKPALHRPDRLRHRLLQRQPFLARLPQPLRSIPRHLACTPDCHSTCKWIRRGTMTD